MQLVSDSLSYPEASLCRIETGEREKGNREGSDGKAFFLFPSSTARSEVFNYCFFIEIPNESLPGGESRRSHIQEVKDDSVRYLRFETRFSCEVLLCNTWLK